MKHIVQFSGGKDSTCMLLYRYPDDETESISEDD